MGARRVPRQARDTRERDVVQQVRRRWSVGCAPPCMRQRAQPARAVGVGLRVLRRGSDGRGRSGLRAGPLPAAAAGERRAQPARARGARARARGRPAQLRRRAAGEEVVNAKGQHAHPRGAPACYGVTGARARGCSCVRLESRTPACALPPPAGALRETKGGGCQRRGDVWCLGVPWRARMPRRPRGFRREGAAHDPKPACGKRGCCTPRVARCLRLGSRALRVSS